MFFHALTISSHTRPTLNEASDSPRQLYQHSLQSIFFETGLKSVYPEITGSSAHGFMLPSGVNCTNHFPAALQDLGSVFSK